MLLHNVDPSIQTTSVFGVSYDYPSSDRLLREERSICRRWRRRAIQAMPDSALYQPKSDSPVVPFPPVDDEQAQTQAQAQASAPSTPTSRPLDKKRIPSLSYKRTLSNSLFSRLNILRSSSQSNVEAEAGGRGEENNDDNGDGHHDTGDGVTGSMGCGALAETMQNSKSNRPRKGSLRKVVLGRSRDRRGSEKRNPLTSSRSTASMGLAASGTSPLLIEKDEEEEDDNTPRVSRAHSTSSSKVADSTNQDQVTSTESLRWPSLRNLSSLSIPSIRSSIASFEPLSSTTSLLTSPTNPTDSTEDDDPELNIPDRVAAARAREQTHNAGISPASRILQIARSNTSAGSGTSSVIEGSYFPLPTIGHKPSPLSSSSPLANQPNLTLSDLLAASVAAPSDIEEENYSYAPTASLGYLILLLTWLVFTVGMGSSFGIWSWAWDVGETPYAPPELEDDPTLPITGYYPALMVLTAVMAWVWVVGAWVGMKYFRHATGG